MPYTETLYHFTDHRNIESIKEKGLLSAARLYGEYKMKFDVDFFPASTKSSRRIDYRKDLNNFIRLSPTDSHPMAKQATEEGRVEELVWLEIDFTIALKGKFEVKFSDINAASNSAKINSDYKTFTESIDTQREVMFRGKIPTEFIKFP